jgi:hypothetical protein
MQTSLAILLAILLIAFAKAASPSAELASSHTQGAEIAAQFAKATGVAITPLMGMSFLGVTAWLQAPTEIRPLLPWYEQPYFWGAGMVLIIILWFGHRIPVINRGFKFIKIWESKVSAIVAIPAVGQSIVASLQAVPEQSRGALIWPLDWLIGSAHAANEVTQVGQVVSAAGTAMVALICLLGGAVVWLMFHTVNVLVILSPVGIVDWVLKGIRLGALGFLILAISINPSFGALVSPHYS